MASDVTIGHATLGWRAATRRWGLAAAGCVLVSACVVRTNDDETDSGVIGGGATAGTGGQAGGAGAGGASGAAGSAGAGGGGVAGQGGTAGASGQSGASGASGQSGAAGADAGADAEAGPDAEADAEAGADASPDTGPDADAGCGAGHVRTPGPIARVCAPATTNECDGSADVNAAIPNGADGNGFDDDCDGLVDEGCTCGAGQFAGSTGNDCWLVPASQVDPVTKEPIGWCQTYAAGNRRCISGGLGQPPVWSGECRGAQAPRAIDLCVQGDLDCDGAERNSDIDCACFVPEVECPTQAMAVAPYPDPANLPEIDGAAWVQGGAAAGATQWKWTVTGGDCDNVLPHPSFAVYGSANAASAAPVGGEQDNLGAGGNQRGIVVPADDARSKVYPAFALSGDYLVRGEFELDGKPYACTVKVQVRAPGIRAEACWSPMPNDLDLHLARLQGATCGSSSIGHGWFDTCETGTAGDDCYYQNCAGSSGGSTMEWGYADSASDTCHGWGSRRYSGTLCENPRLDRDNISCDPSETDPNSSTDEFCGAENINLDNPNDGDRFAVGLHAYTIGAAAVKGHVNIYCNGERRFSLGYDPASQQDYPQFLVSGQTAAGDFWTAAVVEAVVTGGAMTDCVVTPVHSLAPKTDKDGALDYCVDTNPQDSATTGSNQWLFTLSSGYPTSADQLCWH